MKGEKNADLGFIVTVDFIVRGKKAFLDEINSCSETTMGLLNLLPLQHYIDPNHCYL